MEKPKCPKCESEKVYVMVNGNVICRECGETTKQNVSIDQEVKNFLELCSSATEGINQLKEENKRLREENEKLKKNPPS